MSTTVENTEDTRPLRYIINLVQIKKGVHHVLQRIKGPTNGGLKLYQSFCDGT